MRRKPPRFLTAADLAALFAPWSEEPTLVLAVSGGADSMALLGLAREWTAANAKRPALRVATVDHGLRRESAEEAVMVAQFCRSLGVAHDILRWVGKKPKAGLQEAARAARYRLLTDFARSIAARVVMTAHSRTDQAETVLMRLCAGSGIAGLAGMRQRSLWAGIEIARPLLSLERQTLRAACDAQGWPYIDDPSNTDPRFLRSRLRQIMPALSQEGLTEKRLAELAERAARAEDALQAMAQATVEAANLRSGKGELRADGAVLAGAAAEIRIRALTQILRRAREAFCLPSAELRLARLEFLAEKLFALPLSPTKKLTMTLAGLAISRLPKGDMCIKPAPPRRT